MTVTMHTPRVNQGQIVTVSYGWANEGNFYKRIHDASDGSTTWYRASNEDELNDYIDSGSTPWNAVPAIETWTPCDEPED